MTQWYSYAITDNSSALYECDFIELATRSLVTQVIKIQAASNIEYRGYVRVLLLVSLTLVIHTLPTQGYFGLAFTTLGQSMEGHRPTTVSKDRTGVYMYHGSYTRYMYD